MSMIVLQLRWDDVGPEQFGELSRLLPEGRGFPDSECCSRQLRLTGRAAFGTEVWADDAAAGSFLDELPAVSRAAGIEPPQVVAFCLPAIYAHIYRRAAARRPAASAAVPVTVPVIPEQRRPGTGLPVPTERIPEQSASAAVR